MYAVFGIQGKNGGRLRFLYLFLKVVFEGVRGIGFQGDIAIDDITVTPGSCGGKDLLYLFS